MKHKKQMWAGRFEPFVHKLIKIESDSTECTQAEWIQRLVISNARTDASQKVIMEEGPNDPLGRAVIEILQNQYNKKKKGGKK